MKKKTLWERKHRGGLEEDKRGADRNGSPKYYGVKSFDDSLHRSLALA